MSSFSSAYTVYLTAALSMYAVAIWFVLAQAGSRNKKYGSVGKIAGGLVVLYLLLILLFGFNRSLDSTQGSLPTGPLLALVGTILGYIGYRLSRGFKVVLDTIPIHWLIIPQFFRIAGGVFFVGFLSSKIPTYFGITAGLGDILTGVAAPLVAYAALRKTSGWPVMVKAWCIFGLLDFVNALGYGVFAMKGGAVQVFHPDPPLTAITSFPILLIPAFGVPVSVMLHLFTLRRLRQLSTKQTA
jgi:hypothetical protein